MSAARVFCVLSVAVEQRLGPGGRERHAHRAAHDDPAKDALRDLEGGACLRDLEIVPGARRLQTPDPHARNRVVRLMNDPGAGQITCLRLGRVRVAGRVTPLAVRRITGLGADDDPVPADLGADVVAAVPAGLFLAGDAPRALHVTLFFRLTDAVAADGAEQARFVARAGGREEHGRRERAEPENARQHRRCGGEPPPSAVPHRTSFKPFAASGPRGLTSSTGVPSR